MTEALIVMVIVKNWNAVVAEQVGGRTGPYSLIVLLLVALGLTLMWGRLFEAKKYSSETYQALR